MAYTMTRYRERTEQRGCPPGGQHEHGFNDLVFRAMFGLVSAPIEEQGSKLVCIRVL